MVYIISRNNEKRKRNKQKRRKRNVRCFKTWF